MRDEHRKARARHLIATDYGRAADFVRTTGITKSRVSQATGEGQPFGEDAAATWEEAADLPPGWFNNNWPTPKEAKKNGWRSDAPYPTDAPPATPHPPSEWITQATDGEVVIAQFNVGGGMDTRGKLILEAESPGAIKSWRVDRERLRLHVPVYTSLQNLCIVTGFGPSMKPMFNPGDPLLMDRGVNRVDHEGVYFFRVGDEGFIKIIQRVPNFDQPGFVLRIISKNKDDFPPYDISPKNPDFQVIGKILTVWRSEQY